jgi:hypothetical protein
VSCLAFVAGIVLVIVGLVRDRRKIKSSQEIINKQYKEIAELRRGARESEIEQLRKIPHTLRLMKEELERTMDVKKRSGISAENAVMVISELLGLPVNDDWLNPNKWDSQDKVRKAIHHFRKRMGLTKPNAELEATWRLRISATMDRLGIGLKREANKTYTNLRLELNNQCENISQTKLSNVIENYLDDAYALISLKLFLAYGRVKKTNALPPNVKDHLQMVNRSVEKRMISNLTSVNKTLELFKIGEDLDGKYNL